MKSLVIREATSQDISALAHLHVRTFNETHAPVLKNGPSYEVREYQWQQAFQSTDGSWFCFVIEGPKGELIGFAKGQRYAHPDQPDFAGELNKLYLLREYHRGADKLFAANGEFHGGYGWRDLRSLKSICPAD